MRLNVLRQPKQYIPLFFCLGLAVFYLYDYLLRALPGVVGDGVSEAYHLSFFSFGSLCASYYLLYVPLQLVVGIMVDRYHSAYLMVVALLFCAVGCYLFANAHFFWLAALGRVLMGFGAGFVFVGILKAICVRLSVQRFTFYLGIVICVGMLGGLLMNVALVFVVKQFGWRLMCYLLAVMGLLFLTITSFWQKRYEKVYLQNTESRTSLLHDILCIKSYLSNRRLWTQCIIGALLYLPIAGFAESWGVRFLHHSNLLSQEAASLQIGVLFLGFAIGAPVLGWLFDRVGQYQLILTVGAIGATILLSIVLYVPELSVLDASICMFLLGVFSASMVVVLSLNRQLIVSKQQAGKVFGVANFIMMLAGGVAWLIGWLIHVITSYSIIDLLSTYAVNSYQLAFLILPVGSLLAVFLTFFVHEHHS